MVSLGSPPRIAVLTAGYKGLFSTVKIKSMWLLILLSIAHVLEYLFSIVEAHLYNIRGEMFTVAELHRIQKESSVNKKKINCDKAT